MELAFTLAWIFIAREALAALAVFRDAAGLAELLAEEGS